MLNMFQTVCTLYLIVAVWNGWYCTLLLVSQFSVKWTFSLFIFSLYFLIFTESPGSLTLSDQPEISDSVPPRCWNFTYGDPSEMEFFSPNFPSNYSTNLNCARYIEGKFVIYISVLGNILVLWIVFYLVYVIIAGTKFMFIRSTNVSHLFFLFQNCFCPCNVTVIVNKKKIPRKLFLSKTLSDFSRNRISSYFSRNLDELGRKLFLFFEQVFDQKLCMWQPIMCTKFTWSKKSLTNFSKFHIILYICFCFVSTNTI